MTSESTSPLIGLAPLRRSLGPQVASVAVLPDPINPEIADSARDFEAAFITQMLKYSGLGEALTKSGGEAVSAFSDFYLENVAQTLADKGGFGLAKSFYDKLLQKSEEPMMHNLSGDKA